jgi:hypothetical protein
MLGRRRRLIRRRTSSPLPVRRRQRVAACRRGRPRGSSAGGPARRRPIAVAVATTVSPSWQTARRVSGTARSPRTVVTPRSRIGGAIVRANPAGLASAPGSGRLGR